MLTFVDTDFSALPLSDVVPVWKEIRKQRHGLKATTHECTDGYLSTLEKFFGEIPLNKIHAGHLREYQIARQSNLLYVQGRELRPWRNKAGASLINHELVTLKQILKHARLWAPIAQYYHPLPIAGWSPRTVPDEDEERRLFETVRSNPEVALASAIATITNNTTAAGCELRMLKLRHLALREPTIGRDGIDRTPSEIYIPREATKNDERPRRIPLNTAAKLAFMWLLRRAYQLGATDPEHYLIPFRVKKSCYDPARPASRWFLRNNWEKLREAAGMPNLRPHDLRHLAITRMLEGGENEETVQAIAGHVGRKMMEYYSHIRMDAKLRAVMAIDPGRLKKRPAVTVRVLEFPGRGRQKL